MEEQPPIWRVDTRVLNKHSQTADKGRSSSLGFSEVLTPHHKPGLVTKQIHVPGAWTDPLVQLKKWKGVMRFGTWNVRSLFRSVS